MAALMTSCIDNPSKVSEYNLKLPADGDQDPAAGHQPQYRQLFCRRRQHPVWNGGCERNRKAGDWKRSWKRESGAVYFPHSKTFVRG